MTSPRTLRTALGRGSRPGRVVTASEKDLPAPSLIEVTTSRDTAGGASRGPGDAGTTRNQARAGVVRGLASPSLPDYGAPRSDPGHQAPVQVLNMDIEP